MLLPHQIYILSTISEGEGYCHIHMLGKKESWSGIIHRNYSDGKLITYKRDYKCGRVM